MGKIVKKGDNEALTIDVTNNNKPIISLLILAASNTVTIHKAQDVDIFTTKGALIKSESKCFMCNKRQDEDGRCRCTNKDAY